MKINKFKDFTNFNKWFGDSKIKNSEPLICYHGSNKKDIEVFDVNFISNNSGNFGHYGYGIYFSTDRREARIYGEYIYECYIKIEKPFYGNNEQLLELQNNGFFVSELVVKSIDFDSFKDSFKDNKIVYNFIDDIQNKTKEIAWSNVRKHNPEIDMNDISDILEYTTLNKNVDGVPDYIINMLDEFNIKPILNEGFPYELSLHFITDLGSNSKEFTDLIKKLGYDGIWYGTEVVVFEPTQIKSIKNDGTFDSNDPNIYS